MHGDKQAFRAIGKFLDDGALRQQALDLLDAYAFFKEDAAILWQGSSRSYENNFETYKDSLKFSPVLRAFYLSPIEERAEAACGQPHPLGNSPKASVSSSRAMREKLAEGDKLEREAAARYLAVHPSEQHLSAILDAYERHDLGDEAALSSIRIITNNNFTKTSPSNLRRACETLLDSLQGLAAVRLYGFTLLNGSRLSFFYHPVDYYGLLLNHPDLPDWARKNAALDMLETRHPRALFHFACQVFSQKNLTAAQVTEVVARLEQLTNTKIATSGDIANSLEAKREYVSYWAKHYDDYEWNETSEIFYSKILSNNLAESYDGLFKKLAAPSDTVAMEAFALLTQGQPAVVAALAEKYRDILRQPNHAVPSLRYRYLENLCKLVDYCKEHHWPCLPSPATRAHLARLAADMPLANRLHLEDSIAQHLPLQQATELEYGIFLYYKSQDLSFSIARILDMCYSAHWKELLENDKLLEWYLKKSQLFASFGVLGHCNDYFKKIDMGDRPVREALERLRYTAGDKDVQRALAPLFENASDWEALTFKDFVKYPELFNRREIATLPAPKSKGELSLVFDRIAQGVQPNQLRLLYDFLLAHPSVDMVPFVFQLPRNALADELNAQLMLAIYGVQPKNDTGGSFDGWAAYWGEEGEGYKTWGQVFLEEKLAMLEAQQVVDVQALNELARLPFFEQQHYKARFLALLPRLDDAASLRYLSLPEKLSVKEDLHFFNNTALGFEHLDAFPRWFETIGDMSPMATFVAEQLLAYRPVERGYALLRLLRQPWFEQYALSLPAGHPMLARAKEGLAALLEESDFLSAYEEAQIDAYLALLDTTGLGPRESLEAIAQKKLGDGAKRLVEQAIFAPMPYADLGMAIRFLQGQNASPEAYRFINTDFGLPFYDWDDRAKVGELLALIDSQPPDKVYLKNLDKMGLGVGEKKNRLDLKKIYNILKYDIVGSYYEAKGEVRAGCAYACVKLLEMHFGTRLGFHEKLNEGQRFYVHNPRKRAGAWMAYLRGKRIVEDQGPPSFSVFTPNRPQSED